MISEVKLGDYLICPVCGSEFQVTEDTKYIVNDEYVCDWKCFMTKAWAEKEIKKK